MLSSQPSQEYILFLCQDACCLRMYFVQSCYSSDNSIAPLYQNGKRKRSNGITRSRERKYNKFKFMKFSHICRCRCTLCIIELTHSAIWNFLFVPCKIFDWPSSSVVELFSKVVAHTKTAAHHHLCIGGNDPILLTLPFLFELKTFRT